MAKKLKQASREALNQEYYQTAATVGDIVLQIQKLEQQKANLLSNMSVTLKRLQGMPLPKEEQAAMEAAAQQHEETIAQTEPVSVTESQVDDAGDMEPTE